MCIDHFVFQGINKHGSCLWSCHNHYHDDDNHFIQHLLVCEARILVHHVVNWRYFLSVELSFFIANLSKFPHGGYVTLLIAFILFSIMYTWFKARKIKNRYLEFCRLMITYQV